MQKTERTIIAGMTLVTSLAFYWYARAQEKSEVPYIMIGAFIGSVIGETIVERIKKNNNDSTDN